MFNQGFTKSIIAIATFFTQPVVAEQIATETEIEHIAIWSTQVQTSSLYLNKADIINKQADHLSGLLPSIPGVDVGVTHSLNQRITIRSITLAIFSQ